MLGVDFSTKQSVLLFCGILFRSWCFSYQVVRPQGAWRMDPIFQTLDCRGHVASMEWLVISLANVLSFGVPIPLYKRWWVGSFGRCP